MRSLFKIENGADNIGASSLNDLGLWDTCRRSFAKRTTRAQMWWIGVFIQCRWGYDIKMVRYKRRGPQSSLFNPLFFLYHNSFTSLTTSHIPLLLSPPDTQSIVIVPACSYLSLLASRSVLNRIVVWAGWQVWKKQRELKGQSQHLQQYDTIWNAAKAVESV